MFDPELESFKTAIDLRAYAASQGYVLDPKESWGGSAVMRHAGGDKVIIKRDADGHYVYFSVRDDADHGTIIDFAQSRLHLNFGVLRKELRPWVGRQAETLPYPPLTPTAKDRMRVETAYAGMQDASGHPFTGFATGGSKGLWLSEETPDDNRLVFCESAIDALSYAVLFPDDRTRYASIGGQLSPQQRELMRAAAAGMPRGTKIIAATDADAPGGKLADDIREAVELTGRDDLIFVLHQPEGFKDWNDQLRNRPTRPPSSSPKVPSVA